MQEIIFDVWNTLWIPDYFKKKISSDAQVNLGELLWYVESQVKASPLGDMKQELVPWVQSVWSLQMTSNSCCRNHCQNTAPKENLRFLKAPCKAAVMVKEGNALLHENFCLKEILIKSMSSTAQHFLPYLGILCSII